MKKPNSKNYEMSTKEYIEFLSMKSNEINMRNGNSKTGVACLNLAFPTCTCRADAPCREGCYACKGYQAMASTQAAYYRNFRLYNEDPYGFFEQVRYKIKYSGLPMVRLFDCGDIPDDEFLQRMCEVCKEFPNVKFMAFTKQYEIVNRYINKVGDLPKNFNIVFSAWDKLWNFDNPHDLPVAYVKFKEERLTPYIPKSAFHCPGHQTTCSACRMCWNKKMKAVYFDQH